MKKPPELIRSEIAAKSRIFTIEKRELRFTNGVEVQYERLLGSKNGAVLIVPMLDENTVLLIREFAAGVHRYELALPKGRIENNEPIEQAANREIMEEVGYGAKQLRVIKKLSTSPSYMSHYIHVVLACDLYENRLPGDEPEEIEVVPWKLDQLHALVTREECTEARSIAALYMVRDLIQNT